MYYIFLKCPFLLKGENMVVIRSVPDSNLELIPKYIKEHHEKYLKKIMEGYPTEKFETDPKYRDYYPLKETPRVESQGDIQGIPSSTKYLYSKQLIDRGWIYNSYSTVNTTFEYSVCRYDACLKIPDPLFSQKKEAFEDIKSALLESLRKNKHFTNSVD